MGEMSLLGELSLEVLAVIPVLPSRPGLRARHGFNFSQPDAGCICPVWVENVSSMRLVSRSLGSQLCQCYGELLPSCDIVLLESRVVQKCCYTLINVHKRDDFHQLLGGGGVLCDRPLVKYEAAILSALSVINTSRLFKLAYTSCISLDRTLHAKAFLPKPFCRCAQCKAEFQLQIYTVYTIQFWSCSAFFFFLSWGEKCRTAEVNRLGSRQTPLLVWVAFPLNAGKEGKKFFPRKFSEGRRCDGAAALLGLLQVRCASDKKNRIYICHFFFFINLWNCYTRCWLWWLYTSKRQKYQAVEVK